MKKLQIVTEIEELTYDELTPEDRGLIDRAKAMTRTSYVPYSHFHVGAALLMANGETVTGSNQENAAFSPTMCAERNAAFQAGALYPGVAMKKIAIRGGDSLRTLLPGTAHLPVRRMPSGPAGIRSRLRHCRSPALWPRTHPALPLRRLAAALLFHRILNF